VTENGETGWPSTGVPSVRLFVERKPDGEMLRRCLSSDCQVADGTVESDFDSTFDLAIIDSVWLQRLTSRIASRRQDEEPLFLPFLLVASPHERPHAVKHLGCLVDDVVYTPVPAPELRARIQVLLHTRALSLESRRNYFELADASPVAIVLVQDDMVVYANPVFAALAGISPPGEAVGRSLVDFLDSRDIERIERHCDSALEHGRKGGLVEPVETRVTGSSGSRWVDLRTSPIRFHGKPALLALLRDRTERKALELIHEATVGKRGSFDEVCRRLTHAIAHEFGLGHVGICVRDGLASQGIAQVADDALVQTNVGPFTRELCEIVFETGQSQVGIPAHGQECLTSPLLSSCLAVPVKTDVGGVHGVIWATAFTQQVFGQDDVRLFETLAEHLGGQFDIDALRQERTRARRMELLGQLTSGVAHEVRNPINAILATAEALDLDIGENAEHGEAIRQICQQVERVSLLMRDLLDLGKPIQEASRVVCRLEDTCKEAVTLWQSTTTLAGHSVTLITDGVDEATRVFVDRDKMRQVVLNLIENAAQHSPGGSEIRLVLLPPSGSFVGFLIVDSGTGVAPDDLLHLFEPFYTKYRKGTGLGLSIVKHIIESHGGAVSIRNNVPLPGCSVEVALPVAQS